MSPEIDTHALAEEVAALIGKPTPPLMDADEAAAFLHLPVSWVRQEARANRIPNVKLGRYTRFRVTELEAWVDGRSVGPRVNGKPPTKGRT